MDWARAACARGFDVIDSIVETSGVVTGDFPGICHGRSASSFATTFPVSQTSHAERIGRSRQGTAR